MKPYTAIKPRLCPVAERYSSPNRRLTAWRSPNTTISSIRKTTEASKRVFFLFSRTKIGRSRPSINDRYAISAQNILRSCVVRYFLPKFIAGCPSVPSGEFKKKRKKCVYCAGWCIIRSCILRLLAIYIFVTLTFIYYYHSSILNVEYIFYRFLSVCWNNCLPLCIEIRCRPYLMIFREVIKRFQKRFQLENGNAESIVFMLNIK